MCRGSENPSNRELVFQVRSTDRWGLIILPGLWFSFLLLLLALLVLDAPETASDWAGFLATATILLLLGLASCWLATRRNDSIHVDDAGITYVRPRGRRVAFKWEEIGDARTSPVLGLVLRRAGSRETMVICRVFQNFSELIDEVCGRWYGKRLESRSEAALPRVFTTSCETGRVCAFVLLLGLGYWALGRWGLLDPLPSGPLPALLVCAGAALVFFLCARHTHWKLRVSRD